MAPSFTPKPFPLLEGYPADHPYQVIHQWLCNVFGAHPADIVATDPAQNFAPVVNLESLMLILGGPWELCVKTCHDAKLSTNDKRAPGKILMTGDEKDGSFLAGAAARAKAQRLAGGGSTVPVCASCGCTEGYGHVSGCAYFADPALVRYWIPGEKPVVEESKPEVKEFTRSAAIALDNAGKASDREKEGT